MTLLYCLPANSYPCQLVLMPTRTHVNSYHQYMSARTIIECQLVPNKVSIRLWYDICYYTTYFYSYPCQIVLMSTHTTNICQVLSQVMSTHTQQGKYQMVGQVDISYYTTYVSWYHHCMSTRTKYNSGGYDDCRL